PEAAAKRLHITIPNTTETAHCTTNARDGHPNDCLVAAKHARTQRKKKKVQKNGNRGFSAANHVKILVKLGEQLGVLLPRVADQQLERGRLGTKQPQPLAGLPGPL